MSVEKILAELKSKQYKPIYLLHGDEDYYIDQIVQYAEHQILSEEEASFNMSIFYGKDAEWAQIMNACRRYPMFAENQVVLLKEAQHMKDLEKLEPYIESPLASTIFIIAHKEKTLDKRFKLYKAIDKKGSVLLSERIKDYQLNAWIKNYIGTIGFTASAKAISLLEENIGADLSRIVNEIEKLKLNIGSKTAITEDDIEKYIGISKEYNAFELQAAIARKDVVKAIKIINYFEGNPKAGPIQMLLPALYSSFSKIYSIYSLPDKSEAALKPHFYFNGNAVKAALDTIKAYQQSGIERILMLLHQYNLKSIGIGNQGNSDAELMKEMVMKMVIG